MAKPSMGMRVHIDFHRKILALQTEINKKTGAKISTIELTDMIAQKLNTDLEKAEINNMSIKYDFRVKNQRRHSIFDF